MGSPSDRQSYTLKESLWFRTKIPNDSSKATSSVLWQPMLTISPLLLLIIHSQLPKFMFLCTEKIGLSLSHTFHLCMDMSFSIHLTSHISSFCLKQKLRSFILFSNPDRQRPNLQPCVYRDTAHHQLPLFKADSREDQDWILSLQGPGRPGPLP